MSGRIKLSGVIFYQFLYYFSSFLGIYVVFNNLQPTLTDLRVVSKLELATGLNCTDYSGNLISHKGEWTSSSGSCDNNICYYATVGTFEVQQRCYPITADDNPDAGNCYEVSNSTLSFPDCCPRLECATASPLTTLAPTACYDRSNNYSCGIWYNMTDGCQSGIDDLIYNITTISCRKYCGFC